MRTVPLVALLLLTPLGALAQGDRLYLPQDHEAQAAFERFEELGARGQWDRVVKGLDRLHAKGGGRLLGRDGAYRSVRSEARRRLLALTGEGRRAYEVLHDDAAEELLEASLRTAELGPLLELLAKHPAATSATRARYLLMTRLSEGGDAAAALVHADALLEGRLEDDERTRVASARVLLLGLAGRKVEALRALEALELDRGAADALRRRLVPLGRRTPGSPVTAQELVWNQEVFGYYDVDAEDTRPWSVPRADAATAYMHDGSHAIAVDQATGKLRWRTNLQGQDAFKRPDGPCPLALAPRTVLCALPGARGLTALDRRDGHLLWTRSLTDLRRAAGIDFAAHMATTAPPAVVGDVAAVVLVTDHSDREVHVLGVELTSGELAWSVLLASEEEGSTPHPTLTQGAGRFVVVTGNGAIAALDTAGEVLWLRTYTSRRDKVARHRRRGRFPLRPPRPKSDPFATRHPGLFVSRGLVWAAPVDVDGILTFDVKTGESRGERLTGLTPRLLAPRGDGALAITRPGQLIRVTRAEHELICVVERAHDAPAALVGDVLYLPTARGVAAVELPEGQVDLAVSWETSRGAGHVLASGGRLLIAAPRGLYAHGPPGGVPARGLRRAADPARRLGDPRFAVREAAEDTLRARREAARATLTAARDDRDPEVALRSRRLLGELDRARRQSRWKPLVKRAWTLQVVDLLSRLTHPHPDVRLEALQELGRIDDERVFVLLTDLLADPDLRVAFTAASVLLERGDPTAGEALAETLRRRRVALLARAVAEGDPVDRQLAARLLAEYGDGEDLPALRRALTDGLPSVRAAAVRGLLKHGGAEELDAVTRLLKTDPSPKVRLAVVQSCVEFDVDMPQEILAVFVKAMGDENDEIRAEAVSIVAKLRSPEAYQALGRALGDSVHGTARAAAKRLYRIAQTDDVLEIPVQGIEGGAMQQNADMRNYTAQIALRFMHRGGVLSVPTITRFLSDSNHQIRRYRFRSGEGWPAFLQQRVSRHPCDAKAVEALANLTLAGEPELRRAGYEALAKASQAPGAKAHLAQGLGDQDPQIRRRCAEWLLPTSGGTPLLDVAAVADVLDVSLRSTRPEGRAAATQLLDRAPLKLLVPGLLRILADAEAGSDLRASAALRVESLSDELRYEGGDTEALRKSAAVWWWKQQNPGMSSEQLRSNLSSENPSVRWRAAKLAAGLPTRAVRDALIVSLDEPEAFVLEEKLKALARITGEDHGLRDGLSPAELAECAKCFQAWFSRKVVEEATGGLGPN